MIYLTGDIHGDISVNRLGSKRFTKQASLTKEDYVIILGDFGLVWDNSPQERYWLKWLNNKNFTTLFIDGNHENFDLLYQYPVKEWQGGLVHEIRPSIFHLMRGHAFNIGNHNIFVMGGAASIDKVYRKEGKSWWKQEIPNREEINRALDTLENHNYEFDYILTHNAPINYMPELISTDKVNKEEVILLRLFQKIYNEANFKHWYFGHHHINRTLADDITVLYNDTIPIGYKFIE